jgi:DNA-directed RNA polymerase specialized sigma24 family protein
VRSALARLKPVQAQLLTLRSHGLSYRELAAALGIKPQSIGPMLLRSEAAFEKAYRRVAAGRR